MCIIDRYSKGEISVGLINRSASIIHLPFISRMITEIYYVLYDNSNKSAKDSANIFTKGLEQSMLSRQVTSQ